ncbi:MAG: deoxyribonuclease IV [Thaumarchaeota archaeon]|nr:deoxyribonuclease IV [Nitrososphaerota archaeon]
MVSRNARDGEITHDVGIHVSISGKIDLSVDRAIEIGCRGAFQIFTCSPRRWNASPLDQKEVEAFREKATKNEYRIFAHMPYLPNLSSPDPNFYSESIKVLTREITRCDDLGVKNLVLHFGSHMNTSIESGKKRIVEACKRSISETKQSKVRMLLENSADAKSVGARFETIAAVLKELDDDKRTGVCLDTCHAFASGYDLRTPEAVKTTLENLDSTIGIRNLYLIHFNDSKGPLGSASDRHEHVGKGEIGLSGMSAVLNSGLLNNLPVVLETPSEEGIGKRDIAIVKKLIGSA